MIKRERRHGDGEQAQEQAPAAVEGGDSRQGAAAEEAALKPEPGGGRTDSMRRGHLRALLDRARGSGEPPPLNVPLSREEAARAMERFAPRRAASVVVRAKTGSQHAYEEDTTRYDRRQDRATEVTLLPTPSSPPPALAKEVRELASLAPSDALLPTPTPTPARALSPAREQQRRRHEDESARSERVARSSSRRSRSRSRSSPRGRHDRAGLSHSRPETSRDRGSPHENDRGRVRKQNDRGHSRGYRDSEHPGGDASRLMERRSDDHHRSRERRLSASSAAHLDPYGAGQISEGSSRNTGDYGNPSIHADSYAIHDDPYDDDHHQGHTYSNHRNHHSNLDDVYGEHQTHEDNYARPLAHEDSYRHDHVLRQPCDHGQLHIHARSKSVTNGGPAAVSNSTTSAVFGSVKNESFPSGVPTYVPHSHSHEGVYAGLPTMHTCSCAHAPTHPHTYPYTASPPHHPDDASMQQTQSSSQWGDYHAQHNPPPLIGGSAAPRYHHHPTHSHQEYPHSYYPHPPHHGYSHTQDRHNSLYPSEGAYEHVIATAISPSRSSSRDDESTPAVKFDPRRIHRVPSPHASLTLSRKRRAHEMSSSSSQSDAFSQTMSEEDAMSDEEDDYEDNAIMSDIEDETFSNFTHSVHMFIPDESVGCIIGRKGAFIREIIESSNCTLSVRAVKSSQPHGDRALRIYGKPLDICVAQQLIIERVREHNISRKNPSYTTLTNDLLVPLPANTITSALTSAVAAADMENEAEASALTQTRQWFVSKDDVGKIMGQEGRILRAIQRDTGTTIRIMTNSRTPAGSSERIVSVTGTQSEIDEALAIIKSKVGGRPSDSGTSGNGKCGQYFAIPSYAPGFLIGSKGDRIRKIQDETGARFHMPAEENLPFGCVNRILHIQGTPSQVSHGSRVIRHRLESYKKSLSQEELEESEDGIFLQLLLQKKVCTHLLNRKGILIRQVTEQSGARARILSPIPEARDQRICLIFGAAASVFLAERLLLQVIARDVIASKRSGAGGDQPRKSKRVRVNERNVRARDLVGENGKIKANHIAAVGADHDGTASDDVGINCALRSARPTPRGNRVSSDNRADNEKPRRSALAGASGGRVVRISTTSAPHSSRMSGAARRKARLMRDTAGRPATEPRGVKGGEARRSRIRR